VENKCKVFVWILIHGKLLTADNLVKRGWPHEEKCVLCNGPLETGLHLCLCCSFAKAIWSQILAWEHFDVLLGPQQNDPQIFVTGGRTLHKQSALSGAKTLQRYGHLYLLEPLEREEHTNIQQ